MRLITTILKFFKNIDMLKTSSTVLVELSDDQKSYNIISPHGYKANVIVDSFYMFFSFESYRFCVSRKRYNIGQKIKRHERGDDLHSLYTFIKLTGLFNLDKESIIKFIGPHSESLYSSDFYFDHKKNHNEIKHKGVTYGFFNIINKTNEDGLVDVIYQKYDDNKRFKNIFAGYFFGNQFVASANLKGYFESARSKFNLFLKDDEYDDDDYTDFSFDMGGEERFTPLSMNTSKSRNLAEFVNFAYAYLDLSELNVFKIKGKYVTQYLYNNQKCFVFISHKEANNVSTSGKANYFVFDDGKVSMISKHHKNKVFEARIFAIVDGKQVQYSGYVDIDSAIQYYTDIFKPLYNNEEIFSKYASKKIVKRMIKEGIISENGRPTFDDLEVYKMLLI
jgi:hypothetical protein